CTGGPFRLFGGPVAANYHSYCTETRRAQGCGALLGPVHVREIHLPRDLHHCDPIALQPEEISEERVAGLAKIGGGRHRIECLLEALQVLRSPCRIATAAEDHVSMVHGVALVPLAFA